MNRVHVSSLGRRREKKKRGCKFMLQRERSTVETKMDGIKVKQNVKNRAD
jgi:hypothetical protein